MQYMYHIFDKLLTLFKKSKRQKLSSDVKPTGRISFILDGTDNIDIECILPNMEDIHNCMSILKNYQIQITIIKYCLLIMSYLFGLFYINRNNKGISLK